MSRYCASCGKLLADDAKFCTSCGAPVEQTAASNGQPAFEQTGSLDTPQTKPDDPLAYRPDPAAGPAAVETTQRMPVAGTPPQQQPASTCAPDSPRAPAAKKSGTKALIAVIVVLVAIIIALVIFFVIKPFDNAATQTTAEVTKLHHDVDADDLKPLDDPNSLYDDDDDDDDDHEHEHEHHHDHDEHDHDHCCGHEHDHDDHDHDEHGHDHCCGHHHHHHHADEVFTSWGTETPRKYTDDEIRTALDALINEHCYGVVLRAKGIVPATDGGWIHFDYVPGESDVRRGSAQVTGRVCVIGSHLAEDALKELFHIG